MNDFDVAIAGCPGYSEQEVNAALDEVLAPLGGLDWVYPGMRIIIKPNLVSFKKPEAAATTHPALLKALCLRLIERGAQLTIGDSPGGPHSTALLNRVYLATGMTELEKMGVKLNRDMSQSLADYPQGSTLKRFRYTSYLNASDAIIDFCKLKSHGMMGMSAAVKNLFGVVPGLVKPEMHYQFPQLSDFADMLIDLNEYFKPRLTVVDAVIGMEGDGPTAGTPRSIGAVVASRSTYYADLVCAALIGLNPLGVPTIKAAYERGLAPESCSKLSVYGDVSKFIVPDFEVKPIHALKFMEQNNPLGRIASVCLAQRPVLHRKLCIGCKECLRICPAGAISLKRGYPFIDRKKCIRCFCCQEFCPRAALKVHRPIAARIINGIKS